MNKKQWSFILSLTFMITLSGCAPEKTSKTSEPLPSIDVKLYQNNDSTLQDSPNQQTTQNNSNTNTKEEIQNPTDQSSKDAAQVKAPMATPIQTTFKQGDICDKVREIQQKLNRFGYNLNIDGVFGASTYYAALDFQMRNKIPQDGIIGELTLEKLDKAPTAETMFKPPVAPNPIPGAAVTNNELEKFVNSKDFPSLTAYFIWLDIPHQKVNIFNGSNNNWHLIKSMVCSSGKATTPTVKGNFVVGNKGLYFYTNYTINGKEVKATCKYFTQISGNYLFHSVIYNSSGSEIIDGTLGIPVSHGCVRLAVENAKFIYDNIPAGTSIWSK